ncbi:hypothetical protein BCR35DRAFT_343619 [Leucosporidium creatinivorum]|uniref:Acetoacetate decarboxylase n=1 Tax=Leucosporidium creatinivorum TaxID=106004 RepID=A0A1Y2G0C3_9BASI|nr:hypothetical protein BCR35DRAFT_343619 [Leucosporidium creatinivorum]
MTIAPLSFESTGRFHRVPIGFGPAPTPRQDAEGNRFDWRKSEATTVGVTYSSDHDALNSILPEGYSVDPSKEAIIMYEVMELRNLPWLAGRGYNTLGVYIGNVKCTRTSRLYEGSYMAVLFESFTDPITTGREELGFCKLYADLPDAITEGSSRIHTASWFGKQFLRLEIPGLQDNDVSEAPAHSPRPWTHPTQTGILHHRYVPSVGQPGKHDASYSTWCPPPAGSPKVLRYQTIPPSQFDKVKLDIAEGKWEELPTLWNVVESLRRIPRLEVKEVAVQRFQGASDLMANQRID